MGKTLLTTKFTYWILVLFAVQTVWFVRIMFFGLYDTEEAYYFNWFYGFIALSGALYGLLISSRKWGSGSSIIGRGLIFLPLGLLSQYFGVQAWFYYNISGIDVPYPSLADFGFFGLVPLYAIGAWYFARAAGARFSLKTTSGKVLALLIPSVAFSFSYALLLRDVGVDPGNPLKTFLDFAYPLGELIPISLAIYMLSISRKFFGGRMKSRILLLIAAFTLQFVTEYAFLYAAGAGLYVNGGIHDYLYASSYTLMSLALIAFRSYK